MRDVRDLVAERSLYTILYYTLLYYTILYHTITYIYIYNMYRSVYIFIHIYIYIYIYIHTSLQPVKSEPLVCRFLVYGLTAHISPSHRRGTLKGVPTVKSLLSHSKSNLFLEPLLAYPFRGTMNIHHFSTCSHTKQLML